MSKENDTAILSITDKGQCSLWKYIYLIKDQHSVLDIFVFFLSLFTQFFFPLFCQTLLLRLLLFVLFSTPIKPITMSNLFPDNSPNLVRWVFFLFFLFFLQKKSEFLKVLRRFGIYFFWSSKKTGILVMEKNKSSLIGLSFWMHLIFREYTHNPEKKHTWRFLFFFPSL